tara:strand:+ start:1022 stop:1252 length:231 start_codon:yes stop_codon:yes gene_type:complete
MSGFNAGRKTRKISNRNCGGGTKKQGLVPRVSFGYGPTLRYIRRRGGPVSRQVYYMNQLTGRIGSRRNLRYRRYRR